MAWVARVRRNPEHLQSGCGMGSFIHRHADPLTASYSYRLPVGKGQKFLASTRLPLDSGGWSINGTTVVNQASPVCHSDQSECRNRGVNQRPTPLA